jgi:hypothetical protein
LSILVRDGDFELTGFTDEKLARSGALFRIKTLVLNDKSWASHFGSVEAWLLSSERPALAELRIDLRRCIWADPLPLLALLLLSRRLVAVGTEVTWQLRRSEQSHVMATASGPDSVSTGSSASRIRSLSPPGRLTRYLATDGYLEQAIKAKVKILVTGESQREEITTIAALAKWTDLPDDLAYANATVIPAQVLELPPFGDEARNAIANEVDSRLEDPDLLSRLHASVGPQATEGLLASLRLILTETLLNIAEHAYPSGAPARPGAYYVRFRQGVAGANQAQRETLRLYMEAERLEMPRIGAAYLTDRQGCIEIFIGDSGEGLVRGLLEAHPQLRDKRNPFVEYVRQVLLNGLSSNRERRTEKGALSLIYANATRRGDYIRCFGDSWWLGTACPMPRETSSLQELACDEGSKTPNGLFWHFRIGWDGATDDALSWSEIPASDTAREVLRSAFLNPLSPAQRAQFPSVRCFMGRDAKEEVQTETKPKSNSNKVCVWKTDRNLIKNEILRRIEEIARRQTSIDYSLVVVDITPYEAAAYQWALLGLRVDFRRGWPRYLKRIVLVTNQWKVCAFLREDKTATTEESSTSISTHGYSKYELDTEFSEKFHTEIASPEDGICSQWLATYLKWHASREFWKIVSNFDRSNPAFFNGSVVWGRDGSLINGYLDFGEVAQISACRQLLTNELIRFLPTVSSNSPDIFGIDSFASSILERMSDHRRERPDDPSEASRLALGSVLVTGSTLQAYALTNCTTVHFLAHPDSYKRGVKETCALLYWPTGDDWFSKHFEKRAEVRRRIGTTAAASPLGDKTYLLPRYDSLGRTLAARGPYESYRDFQEVPAFVRIGHWSYGAHHDVLTPNVRAAIDRSFIAGTGAVIYIGCVVCLALGIKTDKLTDSGRDAVRNYLKLFGNRDEFNIRTRAVVYPTHGNATYLIDRVADYFIAGSAISDFRSRVIGIVNIRASTQRLPLLPSPSAQERLRSLLNKGNSKKLRSALIVDDAVITGKTHAEIMSLLHSLGAESTHTLVLFDRQRLPGGHLPKAPIYSYWKMDLPPIGERDSCPMCNATEDFLKTAKSICSTHLRKHFQLVAKRWEALDPSHNWHRALPTTGTIPIWLKYGLKRPLSTDVDGVSVVIKNSTAAALFHVELETMTGLDVAQRKVLQRLKIPSSTFDESAGPSQNELFVIELVASISLYFTSVSSPARRTELFETLVKLVCSSPNSGDHTSFASLAVTAALPYLKELGTRYFDDVVRRFLPQDTDALSEDARMMLAILMQKGLVSRDHDSLGGIARVLSPAALPLASLYNFFNNELLSPIGTTHSRPLAKIAEGRTNFQLREGGEQSSIREATDSADFIAEFCDCIPLSCIRSGKSSKDATAKDLINSLRRQAIETREELDEATATAELVTRAAESCTKLLDQARIIRDRLFAATQSIDSLVGECRKTQETAQASQSKRTASLSQAATTIATPLKPQEERWVVWDGEVNVIVADLLGNALEYAIAEMPNPWSDASTKASHAWYKLHFADLGLNLEIANKVRADFSMSSTRKKGSSRFRHLEALGGAIDFEQKNSRSHIALIAKIFLPYAGLCKPN